MEINYTIQIWKEGDKYVSYEPRLEIASCGYTIEEARKNLDEAVLLFLEAAYEKGTFEQILDEAGYTRDNNKKWQAPELLSLEKKHLYLRFAV